MCWTAYIKKDGKIAHSITDYSIRRVESLANEWIEKNGNSNTSFFVEETTEKFEYEGE